MNSESEKEHNFPALQVSHVVKGDHIKETEMAGKCDKH